jgi:ABC-type multidrug transport system fused ATPase/permease subunit
MGSNYWMSWATEKKGRVDNVRLMGIFALLSGGSSVFILGRTVLMATVAVETAQRLFHGMITSVFRAPVSFFDTTPSSRILSRVSFTSIFYLIRSSLSGSFKLIFFPV